LTLAITRAAQARIAALRGQTASTDALTWLEATTRGAAAPEYAVLGLSAAALARTASGQHTTAKALLEEIEATPEARNNIFYAAHLAALVRTAIAIDATPIAEQLTAGYQPRYALGEHALNTAEAALAEARRDLPAAADGYAASAGRWERFGVVPEHAYALQGHGRCLIDLGQPYEAAPILQRARTLFDRLRATPALTETDALLQHATPLSS
jgi:hypothetical protein